MKPISSGPLGPALTTDEAREVTHMVRRIAAIVLLYPALDASYMAVKQRTEPWPGIPGTSKAHGAIMLSPADQDSSVWEADESVCYIVTC